MKKVLLLIFAINTIIISGYTPSTYINPAHTHMDDKCVTTKDSSGLASLWTQTLSLARQHTEKINTLLSYKLQQRFKEQPFPWSLLDNPAHAGSRPFISFREDDKGCKRAILKLLYVTSVRDHKGKVVGEAEHYLTFTVIKEDGLKIDAINEEQ